LLRPCASCLYINAKPTRNAVKLDIRILQYSLAYAERHCVTFSNIFQARGRDARLTVGVAGMYRVRLIPSYVARWLSSRQLKGENALFQAIYGQLHR
jgi:hypothetical protein